MSPQREAELKAKFQSNTLTWAEWLEVYTWTAQKVLGREK